MKLHSLPVGLFAVVLAAMHIASPGPGSEPAKSTCCNGCGEQGKKEAAPVYSAELVAALVEKARTHGDARRGLMVFASAKSACLSCHRIGKHGGVVGPELTTIARERKPAELVESVLWPQRVVQPEFRAHQVIDVNGRLHQGYLVRKDARQLVLRDPTKPKAEISFPLGDIEVHREAGSLMPDNLTAAMTDVGLQDLLRFLFGLGTDTSADLDMHLTHAQAHAQGPATFPLERAPLVPDYWPHWKHPVNRHRLYDFYARQADYFRRQPLLPPLLAEFPGLDGGTFGHWGHQNETQWRDRRWNDTLLGSVQCGRLQVGGANLVRGVCVRLGDELSAYFNPESATYDAVWSGGFLKFADARHGFLAPMLPDGQQLPRAARPDTRPMPPVKYHGFYRHGQQVLFSYRLGEQEMLDAPTVANGRFNRIVAPRDRHPLKHLLKGGPAQWPQEIETSIELGQSKPYAVDTIGVPFDNPWKSLLFFGGHAFLDDGSALVATMQGDVWRVTGFHHPSRKAKWRRFASGLHQALGIVADREGIFVLGGDQITRLHDLNGDGEADFYEAFSRVFEPAGGHNYLCGLERDVEGRFYSASHQGLIRISPDGAKMDVLATGFRNPDGLGLLPDGTATVSCSEGEWTPASMICAVRPHRPGLSHGGPPRGGKPPELPLAYLPRGLDNSSGGQTLVTSDRWGPLAGQLLHFSFGMGAHFLVLRDEVDGQLQGGVVPLPGEFRSGAHRGRFCPKDGQLYVTGMQGWVSFTPDDGCFQRVRFTGGRTQLPVGFRAHENGVALRFALPLDDVAASPASHFAQCWNYRYGPAYGSPEFSTQHLGMRGHDTLAIRGAHVLDDRRTLFLELPEVQPVNQLQLRVQAAVDEFHDLFLTVHKLAAPFTRLPNYLPVSRKIAPHPIAMDLKLATRTLPNPHRKPIEGARKIRIETGSNLSYRTRSFRVRAGEPIALTLANPDTVPHNWALVKSDALERVGELSNRLIADPEAVLRHYVPNTPDVLAFTDVVWPGKDSTIFFRAPEKAGVYPFLCTFPGHWKIMNGEMVVE